MDNASGLPYHYSLSAVRLTPEIFCENAGRAGRAAFVSDCSGVGLSKNRDGRSNP
jgi:hypothetical protein